LPELPISVIMVVCLENAMQRISVQGSDEDGVDSLVEQILAQQNRSHPRTAALQSAAGGASAVVGELAPLGDCGPPGHGGWIADRKGGEGK
jgi:hypothetical protein